MHAVGVVGASRQEGTLSRSAGKRPFITNGASGGDAYEVSGTHGGTHHSGGDTYEVSGTHGGVRGGTHNSGRDGDVSRADEDTSKSCNTLYL